MKRFLPSLLYLFLCMNGSGQPVPFDPGRGLVVVEVTIDGHITGTFGIDTGADRLYIDRTFAEKNGLSIRENSGNMVVTGVGGTSAMAATDIRSLRLSRRETLYNLSATVVDMQKIGGQTAGKPPDGLIGFDILRRFYVTVDYPNGTMELISHEPDFLTSGEYITWPFEQERHLMLVDVLFDGSVRAPMVFDFCASLTTLEPSLAERLGYVPDQSGWLIIDSMGEGDVVVEDVQAAVIDHSNLKRSGSNEFQGILGASFLYRSKITVDYKRQRIYFH
ncbi:MAG: retropepsin-like domain-containing protein [Candidatus Zixiibacteriota bacterium]|nr:MAG: retropepsin-like domain-containing protein [candidate division Zixibacteria bacterium]